MRWDFIWDLRVYASAADVSVRYWPAGPEEEEEQTPEGVASTDPVAGLLQMQVGLRSRGAVIVICGRDSGLLQAEVGQGRSFVICGDGSIRTVLGCRWGRSQWHSFLRCVNSFLQTPCVWHRTS